MCVYIYIYGNLSIYIDLLIVLFYLLIFLFTFIYLFVYSLICFIFYFLIYLLRKPADRLGKVVLANEVSIRGSGGWTSRVVPKSRN